MAKDHLVGGELFAQSGLVCRPHLIWFSAPSFGVMGLSIVGIPVGKFPNQIPYSWERSGGISFLDSSLDSSLYLVPGYRFDLPWLVTF